MRRDRAIGNMAMISEKRGFSVATVAKGWLLVYIIANASPLSCCFFTLETLKNFQEQVTVSSLC